MIFALIVFGLTSTAHVYAQDKQSLKEKNEPKYGLKSGINFAELWGEDALPESDRKVGYSFSVYASCKISQNLKLQPEVIWSLQGEDSKDSGRYKISYINIPVMLKWTDDRFFYELGPQLGLLTINTTESVPNELRLENFDTFDFSLNLGLGYHFADDWAIGLRYSQGITNIAEARDLKNSVIYVGLVYRIF